MPTPILEFTNVTLAIDQAYDTGLDDVSFSLLPGDLAVFQFDRHSPRIPLPDAAIGILDPAAGSIRFLGDDWQHLNPARASVQRGRIGRLFGGQGWIYNLDIDENVTLSERHHSKRPIEEIVHEANYLATQFGLEHLPQMRPARVTPRELQRSACVRMMMGAPNLTIVDEPPAGLHPDLHAPLISFLTTERRRGAAVLWLSADPLVWEDETINPSHRAEIIGRQLKMISIASA